MPILNTRLKSTGQQNVDSTIDLSEFDELLKQKLNNKNKVEQKTTVTAKVKKNNNNNNFQIPEDFGALDISEASKPYFLKQQDAFDQNGTPKPIKTSYNLANKKDVDLYIHGGVSGEESKKLLQKTTEDKLNKIDFLENKQKLNPGSFTEDDQKDLIKSYKDYDVYKMMSDPNYARIRLDQFSKEIDEINKQLKSEKQPDNYFGQNEMQTGQNPYLPEDVQGSINLGVLFGSDYNKSAMSQYILKSNETQAATSQGKIVRAKELNDLAANVDNYINAAEKLFDIDYKLKQFQNKSRLTEEETQNRIQLLRQRTEAYRDYSKYKEFCNKFTSWRPGGPVSLAYKLGKSAIGNILGASMQDMEDLELNIPSNSTFDNIAKLVENNNKNDTSYRSFKDLLKSTRSQMDRFHNTHDELTAGWKKEYDKDMQDIEDWKNGNNWLGAHAKVDNYFKAQEQLAQMNGMNPFSAQTILYATPGLQGASNSSWYKSIAGTTAKLVGVGASIFGTGGTAALVAGAAGTSSFVSDVSQGEDENNAEVFDGVSEKFKQSLNKTEDYQKFLNEGFNKLKNTPEMKRFRERFNKEHGVSDKSKEIPYVSLGDTSNLREEIETYILNEYLLGRWHSSNPSVIKAHANAVVGSNGYYYNDLLSTTRDSFEDAILTCLPIKAAANAVKGAVMSTKLGQASAKALTSSSRPVVDWMLKQNARASLFAKSVPSELMTKVGKFSMLGKSALNYGLRVGEGVRSEMQEEAEQKLNTDAFINGEFDSQLNTSSTQRIIEDMSKGIPATWDYFVPGNMFGYASDQELIANENGAILLALPMSLLTQTPRVVSNTKRKMSVYDTISQIMRANKYEQMGSIRQNELYAKHLSPQDKEMVLNMFDKYAQANKDISDSQQESTRENDSAIPQEWIEEQRKRYLDFYNYANSGIVKARAEVNGIKSSGEDYATFAALDFHHFEQFKQAQEDTKNAISSLQNDETNKFENLTGEELSKALSEDLRSRTIYEILSQSYEEKDPEKLRKRDQDLAALYSAMQIKDEANAVSSIISRRNHMSRQIQNTIDVLKNKIKKDYGIEINNIDDVAKHVVDINTFDNLKNPSRDVITSQQSEGMLKHQLDQFRSNPKKYINKYRSAINDDNALEQVIEEDYLETLSEKDDADKREVIDGDVYVGEDGNNYKVLIQNGNPVKFKFDDETKQIKGQALPFNSLEYHRAKNAQERVQEEILEHNDRLEEESNTEQEQSKQQIKEKSKHQEPKKDAKKLSDSPFNAPSSEKVVVEMHEKAWRDNKDRKNRTARIYLDDNKEKGYFEIVIDKDFNTDEENGEYSVHFKPKNGDKDVFTNEDKKQLFDALSEMIPDGGIVSTYATKGSGITKGGIHGLDRLAKDYGFQKVSDHPYKKNKKGNPVKRTWYMKKTDEKIQGSFYIKGEIETQEQVETKKPKASTPNQQTTLDELNRKTKSDTDKLYKKGGKVVKTGHDYFLKFKNGIVRYIRVHGLEIMDSMYPEKNKADVKEIKNKLQDLQQTDVEAYKKEIIRLQDEFNQKLEQKYGKDSDKYSAYNFHKIDLQIYTHDDLLSDIGVPEAIAQIVSRNLPNASVISGTIIDEIARIIFSGESVKNADKIKYKIQDVFDDGGNLVYSPLDDLVSQLKECKRHYEEDLGWVLDTTPHVWYCTLKNGQRVAGETDMIAIDKDGKIHILDFKTTKIQLENVKQYKNPEYDKNEEDSEEWIDINKYTVVPEGVETREFSKFVLGVPNGAKRSYGQQYIRQLTAYQNIISSNPTFEVEDLQLVPIYVEKTFGNTEEELANIDKIQVGNLIKLTGMPELQDDVNEVNSYLNKSTKEPYTKESIKESKRILKEYVNLLNQWKKLNISSDTKRALDSLITDIKKYDQKLDALSKDKSKMKESATVEEYDKKASRIKNRLDKLKRKVQEEDENAIVESGRRNRLEQPDNTYQPLFDEAPEGIEDNEVPEEFIEDDEVKDITEEEFSEEIESNQEEKEYKWYEHNNLAGLTGLRQQSFINKIKTLFKRVKGKDAISVRPDFIKNAKFTVYKDGKRYKVDIEYGDQKFEGLLLNIGNDGSKKRSSLGRRLVKQFETLSKQINKEQKIIATNVSRTNGQIIIGENISFVDSVFMNNSIMERLIAGEDSLLGISDGERIYALQETSNKGVKPTIYAHKGDANDSEIQKEIKSTFGKFKTNSKGSITSGTIVFLYKFKYEEDSVDDAPRVIPITLRPKNLTKKDAETVIRILQQGEDALTNDFEATVTNSKGTDIKKIIGLSNRKVLNMLARFGGQAEKEGSDFIFDFSRNSYGQIQGGGKVIVISDLRKEKKKGKYPLTTIDLTNEGDIEKLKSILQRVQLHCNQEGNLRHNLNGSADTYSGNPYSFLTKFFENESNEMDIDSRIEISDSISIDGSDIYANDDKSRGLSGAAWMIKHGMLETNVHGLENPLISINELGIEGQTIQSLPKKEYKKDKEPIQQDAEDTIITEPKKQPVIQVEKIDEEEMTPEEKAKKERIAKIKAMRQNIGGVVPGAAKGHRNKIVKHVSTVKRDRQEIINNLYSIFGKYLPNVRWFEDVIEKVANGCVVGRIVPDAILLYDAIEPGQEYHEAFHRVLDILLPVKVLEKLQKRYKERHNEEYKKQTGEDLDESSISEGMADLFMEFKQNNSIVTDQGVKKLFSTTLDYVKSLKRLKDWQLASIFMAVNTGLFKHIKPNQKSIERFKRVTEGYRNLTIRDQNTGELVEFDQFANYDGRKMYDAAVEGLLYALITGQNVTDFRQTEKLDTSLKAISKLDFTQRKPVEGEEMSPWFKIVSGQYIKEGVEFNEEDAVMFEMMYRNTPVMDDIYEMVSEELPEDFDQDDLDIALIDKIIELESVKTSIDELQGNQRMMHEMMKHPDILHQQLNKKLAKLQVQSKKVINNDNNEGVEVESWMGEDIAVHDYSEFYKHSRSESAAAQVVFFLSVIPDIRFATQEDVDNGTVPSLLHKSGDKRTVQNGTNILGYKQFVPFKTISNKLLQKCCQCKNPKELDEALSELGKTDAIFWTIAKRFHNHLQNSLIRHDDKDRTPKVYTETRSKDGKHVDINMLDINDYNVVTDENGNLIAIDKKGKPITNAKFLVNHSEESLVTQIWQYVRCQRLDFTFLNIKQFVDEKTGESVDGKYDMSMTSTDSDYASTIYPREWFNRFRNPLFGIFKARTVKEGDKSQKRLIFAKHGRDRVVSAISNISAIRTAFRKNNSSVTIIIENENGEFVEKRYKTSVDFINIENQFIESLNTIGIGVDKDVFEECICTFFGTNDVTKAMFSLCQSTDTNISLSAFVKDLKNLSEKLQNRDFSILTENKAADKSKTRSNKDYSAASGINIFSDSAFIKELAHAYSRHQRMTKELMTLGPNHTKRYTMAQCHTASDITDMIIDANISDDGVTIVGSDLAKDMAQYSYNLFYLPNRITKKLYPIGSRLLKGILSGENKNLKLHTHGGVKTERSKTGGKDYKEISAREDYLAKMEILRTGGMIFPTLSDKATWFYITGCKLAGYDYKSIDSISKSQIPDIVKRDGKFRIEYEDYSQNIDVLDQLIEYARCEHEMIRGELKRKKHLSALQKIKNFFTGGENAVRYATMTEFYTFDEEPDENGRREYKATMHLLTDYGKTPQECFDDAEQYFFGPTVSDAQRRRSMAMCLQRITEQNLKQLVEYGLIEKDDSKSTLKGYSNVGLNSFVIDKLTDKILKENKQSARFKNKNAEEKRAIAESEAIISYVNDICAKSIQSCEETERIFTGMPHFFKWKHEKIKDQFTGKEYDCLYDRYDDEVKRHGGLGSTGDQNRTDLPNQEIDYTCAECDDPKVQSEVLYGYEQGFEDNEFRESWFNMMADEFKTSEELEAFADELFGDGRIDVNEIKNRIRQKFSKEVSDGITEGDRIVKQIEDKVKSEISSFMKDKLKKLEGIAVADGAAYIRPSMAKALLRQRGVLTDKVELAFSILDGTFEQKRDKLGMFDKPYYKKLSSNKPLSNGQAYQIIVDALIGAQKYTAYGYRMAPATEQDAAEGLGQIPIHYYDKFALFPLFPQIATGMAKDLLQQMEEQGIDMLKMDDAIKVGACGSKSFEFEDSVDDDGKVTKTALEKFEEFKTTGFVVYKQKFCFLRRQMNTDPHEDEERNIGTQMLKVALNGVNKALMYIDAHGNSIRGWKMLSRINKNLNNLSDLGEQYFRHRFWKNGEFDVEELSNFLEDQLNSRNADANLLDGIQVVIDPVSGKKRLKVPIEAMSSAGWIESIINSAINADVVDVSSDGNAYYQRSIFGSEGKPITALQDTDRTLYNGQTLKAINEDGSMDAVISIDYFIHLVPKNIRNNFDAARQWLIDNKVIGSEATANTIGYRIPTQSQSSIHPLRFVDVLPIVRDTIILPKDFTAITGSDFDIDKLYLASIHYEKTYKEEKVTGKDGKERIKKVQTGVTSMFEHPGDLSDQDFEKRSKKYKLARKYYQNQLLFDYLTALKDRGKIVDGKYIPGNASHYAYRSVDKDTSLIDDFLDVIEKGKPKMRWLAWQAGSLAYQVAKKAEFMVGKVGIGPFALNNNSQILTQTYGVKFRSYNTIIKESEKHNIPTILECLKASSLANKESKRKNRITAWLSGLINIHVDVAKDPKPKKLNINAFTYNLTALLTRVGLDDNALAFVRQPLMVELAAINERESGEFLTRDPGKSASANVRDAIDEWISEKFQAKTEKENLDLKDLIKNRANGNDVESEYEVGKILQQLFGINDNGEFTDSILIRRPGQDDEIKNGKSILLDILTNPEALIDDKKDASFDNLSEDGSYTYVITVNGIEQTMTPKEVQLWVYFAYKQIDKYAQAMSDVVNTTKIDTKKQGKSVIEQQSYLDQFKAILDPTTSLFELDGLYALYGVTYNPDKDVEDEWDKFEDYVPTAYSKTHDYQIESFIGHKTRNAMRLYKDVMANVSIQATDSFIESHRRLLDMIGASVRDVDRCRKIAGAMMQYLKSEYMFRWFKYEGINPKHILLGENSVQDKLIAIQNLIKKDKTGKYWQYEDNKLLKALAPDIYQEEEGEENYRFIKLDNSFLDEQDDANDIEQAWDELLQDDTTEFEIGDIVITPRDFAKELIAYAFITSADTNGMTKFFKYVPNSWRTEAHDDMCSYADQIYHYHVYGHEFSDEELEEIIRNNWQDNDFVRELSSKKGSAQIIRNPRFDKKERDNTKPDLPWIIGCVRTIKDKLTKQEITRSTVSPLRTTGDFPLFIRRRRPGAKDYSSDSYLLYRLVYVGQKYLGKDKNGDDNIMNYPIYALTYPKGKTYRAGSYTYDIKQYTDDTVYQQKYASRYNTFGNTATNEAIDKLLDYVDNMPSDIDISSFAEDIDPIYKNKQSIRNAMKILLDQGLVDEQQSKAINKAISKLAKEEKSKKDQKSEQESKSKIKGENIISSGSEFAKLLTNVQFSENLNAQLDYNGKHYVSAEHAYQTWKSGHFDKSAYEAGKNGGKHAVGAKANKSTNYQTMVDILIAKLTQHPELVDGITKRGGLEWINASTHDGYGDKYWETKSGQNKFIEALAEAYDVVTKPKDYIDAFTVLKHSGIFTGKVWFDGGRPVVVMNINGKEVPFYRTYQGTGGKKKNLWYPFLGYGKQNGSESDWFIKGSSKEDTPLRLNMYEGYGHAAVKELQDYLNTYAVLDVNDERGFTNHEKVLSVVDTLQEIGGNISVDIHDYDHNEIDLVDSKEKRLKFFEEFFSSIPDKSLGLFKVQPNKQDTIEEYTPLFDEEPEGVEDNGYEDGDEYPDTAAKTCKGGKK